MTEEVKKHKVLTVKFWFIPKGKYQGVPKGYSKSDAISINTFRIGDFVVGWDYYTNEDYDD